MGKTEVPWSFIVVAEWSHLILSHFKTGINLVENHVALF